MGTTPAAPPRSRWFSAASNTTLAVTVIVALAVTLMNLIVDVAYGYLDPRVRYA